MRPASSLLRSADSIMSLPNASTRRYSRLDSAPPSSQVSSDSHPDSQHSARWAQQSQSGYLDSDSQNSLSFNDRVSGARREFSMPSYQQINSGPFVPPSTKRHRNQNPPKIQQFHSDGRHLTPLVPPPSPREEELQNQITQLLKTQAAMTTTHTADIRELKQQIDLVSARMTEVAATNAGLVSSGESSDRRLALIETRLAESLSPKSRSETNDCLEKPCILTNSESLKKRSVFGTPQPHTENVVSSVAQKDRSRRQSYENSSKSPCQDLCACPTFQVECDNEDDEEDESQIISVNKKFNGDERKELILTKSKTVHESGLDPEPYTQANVPRQYLNDSSDEDCDDAEAIDLSLWMQQRKRTAESSAGTGGRPHLKRKSETSLSPNKSKSHIQRGHVLCGRTVDGSRARYASQNPNPKRGLEKKPDSENQDESECFALFQESTDDDVQSCLADEFRFTTSSISQDF